MRRVISGLLLTILLAVTVGVPVFKHTCHVFDRSELSVLDQDSCCDPFSNDLTAQIDVKCCSLEVFDTSLDYETLIKGEWTLAVDFIIDSDYVTQQQYFVYQESEALSVLRPPPLANQELLNRIQVYLI